MRTNKSSFLILVSAVTLSWSACAQTKKTAKVSSGTSYAKLIECSEQTTLPGRQESAPSTQQRILIVWKHTTPPQLFFWRASDGWADCNVYKARKSTSPAKARYEFGENWYSTQDITLDKIKKGDTVELIPYYGGKNTIPEEVTSSMTNKVFFKTKKSGWMYLPVNKCVKRPDIVMP